MSATVRYEVKKSDGSYVGGKEELDLDSDKSLPDILKRSLILRHGLFPTEVNILCCSFDGGWLDDAA